MHDASRTALQLTALRNSATTELVTLRRGVQKSSMVSIMLKSSEYSELHLLNRLFTVLSS